MAKLTIQPPGEAPLVHELRDGVVTIGREADNTIAVPDGSVSRHHAEITFNGGIYTLRDLGSANGTAVNYDPATETALKDGDIIHFGLVEALLALESPPVAEKAESAPPIAAPPAKVDSGGQGTVPPPVVAPPAKVPSAKVEPRAQNVVPPPPVIASPPKAEVPALVPSARGEPIVQDAVPPPVVAPPPKVEESASVVAVKNSPPSSDVGRPVAVPSTPVVPAVPTAKKPEVVDPVKTPPPKADAGQAQPVQPTPVAKKSEVAAPVKTPPTKAEVGQARPVRPIPAAKPLPVAKKPEGAPPAIVTPPKGEAVRPALAPSAAVVKPVPTAKKVDAVRPPVVPSSPVVKPVPTVRKEDAVRPSVVPPTPVVKPVPPAKKDHAVRATPVPPAPVVKPVPPAKKLEIPAPVVTPPVNRGAVQAGPVPATPAAELLPVDKDSRGETPVAAPPATQGRRLIYATFGLLALLAGAVFLLRQSPRHASRPQPPPATATADHAKAAKGFWDKIQQIENVGNQHGKDIDFDQYPKLPTGVFDFSRFDNDAFENFLTKLSQRAQLMNGVAKELASLDQRGVDADLLAYTNDLRGQWTGGATVDEAYGRLVAGLQEQKRRFTGPEAVELRKFNISMRDYSLEKEYQQNQEWLQGLVSRWAEQRDTQVANTMKILAREKELSRVLTERYKTEFK